MWIESGIASNFTNPTTWHYRKGLKCNDGGDSVYSFALKVNQKGVYYIWMKCKSQNLIHAWRQGGSWGDTKSCPNYMMVGFKVQMCNETVGLANLVMYCSRDENDYKTSVSFDASANGSCQWGPTRFCPFNYAICGLMYEYDTVLHSKLGMTNVKMLCCRLV